MRQTPTFEILSETVQHTSPRHSVVEPDIGEENRLQQPLIEYVRGVDRAPVKDKPAESRNDQANGRNYCVKGDVEHRRVATAIQSGVRPVSSCIR